MATQQDYITKADLDAALDAALKPIGDKIDANHQAVMQSIAAIAKLVGRNPNY